MIIHQIEVRRSASMPTGKLENAGQLQHGGFRMRRQRGTRLILNRLRVPEVNIRARCDAGIEEGWLHGGYPGHLVPCRGVYHPSVLAREIGSEACIWELLGILANGKGW
jgi:hypothetical protein